VRKKIIFIIPSLTSGGAERVVTTLANELIQDFDVKIIQLYKSQPFYKINKGIKLDHCRENFNPNLSTFKSITNHFFMIRNIYKIIKQDSDITIGFTTTSNIYTVIASRLLKKPCIISERNNPNYSISNNYWNFIRKKVYPFADKIIVQTEEIKKYYLNTIKSYRLKIIANPIDPQLAKFRNDSVNQKENIILNVGRLNHQKNQELLIKAFCNIPHTDWKLLIVGEGDQREFYQNIINELNEQENIQLVGRINTIHEEYTKANIFAFTSNYEGFPNALIEAMYFGLPCISTDCPTGPSELIDDNKNGFLIPIDNQKILEQKLSQLMKDEKLRNIFGANAKIKVSVFEASIIASEWRNLIIDLI